MDDQKPILDYADPTQKEPEAHTPHMVQLLMHVMACLIGLLLLGCSIWMIKMRSENPVPTVLCAIVLIIISIVTTTVGARRFLRGIFSGGI